MQTTPVGGVGPLSGGDGLARPPATSEATGPFGALFERLLGEVDGRQAIADQAVRDLATGRAGELHNVMLAVSKADLTFRLFLEIRNRLIEAYQEVMRMQV